MFVGTGLLGYYRLGSRYGLIDRVDTVCVSDQSKTIRIAAAHSVKAPID
jgi:hypothetical protein